jgi:predicted alpha/beta-hydrolase family hydrolase
METKVTLFYIILILMSHSMNIHIQDITQMFEYQDLSGVILVGHSYGGLVISGVAEKLANRIKCLPLSQYAKDGRKGVSGSW